MVMLGSMVRRYEEGHGTDEEKHGAQKNLEAPHEMPYRKETSNAAVSTPPIMESTRCNASLVTRTSSASGVVT